MKKELVNLFSVDSKLYATRKVLNRGSELSFETMQSFIENLERDGVTIEMIDALPFEKFKYRTQITLHGFFTEQYAKRVGGYKNLFLNQNKTLGVKYNAIDYAKKLQIKHELAFSDVRYVRDSKGDCFVISGTDYDVMQKRYESIDVSNFYASKHLMRYAYWGMLYYEIHIYLKCIYADDVEKFTVALSGMSADDFKAARIAYVQKKADEQAAREKAYEERKQIAEQKNAAYLQDVEHKIKPVLSWYRKYNGVDHKPTDIFMSYGKTDKGNAVFTFYQVKQSASGQYAMYRTFKKPDEVDLTIENIDTTIETLFNYENEAERFAQQVGRSYGSFSMLMRMAKKKVFKSNDVWLYRVPSDEVEEQHHAEAVSIDDIEILPYTEKAFAVFGNTKAIKDTLMQYHGRYNRYLTYNKSEVEKGAEAIKKAGWVFPLKQLESITNAINKLKGC